jgi:hypothetical protein
MLDARDMVPTARQATPSCMRAAQINKPIVRTQDVMERIFKGEEVLVGTRGRGLFGLEDMDIRSVSLRMNVVCRGGSFSSK